MAETIPALKTGAPAQYPSSKRVSYSSYIVKFLDGSDQRYRNYSVPLTQWSFPLAMLDDSEMTLLGQFFGKRLVNPALCLLSFVLSVET